MRNAEDKCYLCGDPVEENSALTQDKDRSAKAWGHSCATCKLNYLLTKEFNERFGDDSEQTV